MKTFKHVPAFEQVKARAAFLVLLLISAGSFTAAAQSNKLETDKGIAASIAPYDADVRLAILQASQYPNTLVQLQKSQTQTVASFQKMISRFRKQKQEWFYTITRYPDLMHQLASLPPRQTQEAIYKLLPSQDADLKVAAWKLYKNEKKNLAKLDNVRMAANREFENSIAHLGIPARDAFRKLQAMPDVLTLLTNNIELTTRLGEHYKRNPSQVLAQLTTLHDNLEVQNQQEVADFKKQVEKDPKAMKELQEASNAYTANNYYGNPYYYPYSYWFGYPYWYPYPMWYPGMFWYSPGFYFGVGGLCGFPSYGFSFWFYQGGYYTRYPHLYHVFGTYYQNNLAKDRVLGTVNRGFMGVATTHYQPGSTRMSALTSPLSNGRQGRVVNQVGSYTNRVNANSYHAQSWGGFGGRGGAIGGGFHGGGHIGRH